ncbi:hypothetical protein [Xanthomonas sacchari]|uniref:hypothetical protein n=1 Tax=Xanthomonas sacchari TaxID=56458 RepID=UPI00225DD718|nr:hypothetical protein [Xanthomonas sacchari]
MRNHLALQQLRDHAALTKEDRQHLYFGARTTQLRFNVKLDAALLILVVVLATAMTLAICLGAFRWERGVVLLGYAFMAIGVLRELGRYLGRRAFDRRVAGLRVLTAAEKMSIVDIQSRHPEIEEVLCEWALASDELTIAELHKLHEYGRRAGTFP